MRVYTQRSKRVLSPVRVTLPGPAPAPFPRNDVPGAPEPCVLCPRGRYAPRTNSSYCTRCPNGTTSNDFGSYDRASDCIRAAECPHGKCAPGTARRALRVNVL